MKLTNSLILEYSRKNPQSIKTDFKKSQTLIWECFLKHEWVARLDSRVIRNKGCPYCTNQKVWTGFNDAETKLSKFLYLWDYELNFEKPFEVFPSFVAHLKCFEGHRFKLSLLQASKMKEPCPYCGKRKPIKGINDLETLYPEIAREWSKENKNRPSEFLSQSNKVVIWECLKTSHKHGYFMSIQKRVKGRICPYCSKPARKILVGFNDLESKYPVLCEEWSEKNFKNPSECLSSSNEKVWWNCRKCSHSWDAFIYNRVAGSGCPKCAKSNIVSKGEIELLDFLKETLSKEVEVISNTRKVIPPLELDIYIPSLNIAFEFNGDYWHSNSIVSETYGSSYNYHLLKYELCKSRGVKLLYVWESDWRFKESLVKESIRLALDDESIHLNILSVLFKD